MDLQQYKNYSADDFILDDDFREMVSKASPDDRFEEFVNNFPEKRAEILLASKIIRNLHPGEFHQANTRKNELWQQIVEQQNRKTRFLYFRYAASFLLLVGLGSLAYLLINQKQTSQIAATAPSPANDAILILSDGKTVAINSKQSTVQYSADGSGVLVNDSSTLAQPLSSEGFNQMIVPYGKRSFITLSEGTKVWLNSGSKLIFPPAFMGKTREVILEGEALFDVAHNAEKPFYVKTDAFRMKVYGTKFNIQAYQQDQDYNIVLVEGKVSMNSNSDLQAKEVFLAPNQKASIIKGDKEIEVTTVENTDIYTAWVDGYLTFSNEEVADVLERVSRYYNAEIEIEPNANMETIYGKLDLKDDLERVLDGIAFISKTTYIKQEDKYIFKTN
jgi:transmembrane sensor